MTDPVGVRRNIAIAAVVVTVVLGAGLWAVTLHPGPPGPCSSPNARDSSCPAQVTLSAWCQLGVPCPRAGAVAVVQGYTFILSGFTFGNGTVAVEGSVAPNMTAFNGTVFDYAFMLWSNPFGGPTSWVSSDGRVYVMWPDMPIGPVQHPLSVYLLCGVLAPPGA